MGTYPLAAAPLPFEVALATNLCETLHADALAGEGYICKCIDGVQGGDL